MSLQFSFVYDPLSSSCLLLVHLQTLIDQCQAIQKLGLGFCRLLSDAVIMDAAEYLWVEELNISHCGRMTDAALQSESNAQ